MAAVRFYTDEHVSRAVVRGLRLRGIDVLTPPEAGMLGASDEAHLERAHREGRVIYTQDSDFLVLDARGTPHTGIVYDTGGSGLAHPPARIFGMQPVTTRPDACRQQHVSVAQPGHHR